MCVYVVTTTDKILNIFVTGYFVLPFYNMTTSLLSTGNQERPLISKILSFQKYTNIEFSYDLEIALLCIYSPKTENIY